ncbi:MAG: ATP-binding protein [Muribaculaceae bacterium]|nr:ATP-binding protein [Muribaculaceae bacterium]
MERRVKYPIGEQDFEKIRVNDNLYIDKTLFIHKLINGDGNYYFLARPRRFGKSLFLSTLQYFFEGRRDLFKNLYIDSTDWNWESYPVLRIDLNTQKYAESGLLSNVLETLFRNWEKRYGIENLFSDYAQRFKYIIQEIHSITGKQVVILVDEYDKPLVGNLNKSENFERYRTELAALYSNFKSSAEHLRLVFLTGVSRFSKLSVFSDLNNLKDITFSNEYADICGITSEEVASQMQEGIRGLAEEMEVDYDEAAFLLKNNYDGYRFARKGSDIYNPWSLLNCLSEREIKDYWNDTGLPTVVAESLKKVNADLKKYFDSYCSEDELKGFDLLNPKPLALLYQTGYLTIKNYDRRINSYRLGIPNKEVKRGLFKILLPYYVKTKTETSNRVVDSIVRHFIFGEPEEAMKSMQAYFAGIDYKMKMDNENNFHNAFYLLLDLMGLDTSTESHTSEGSIDIVVRTEEYVYIIELKYDRSAEEALRQIEDKHYSRKYRSDGRKLFNIGVSFSSKTRCIENWLISEE